MNQRSYVSPFVAHATSVDIFHLKNI